MKVYRTIDTASRGLKRIAERLERGDITSLEAGLSLRNFASLLDNEIKNRPSSHAPVSTEIQVVMDKLEGIVASMKTKDATTQCS